METEREWAQAIVRDATRRYLASRRDRTDAFVDRHLTLSGTLRLHRCVIGWDLVRIPANLLLAPAALGIAIANGLVRRAGATRLAAWLGRRQLLFETAIGREVSWLVTTEFLQLPCVQPGRSSSDDELAEMILADPRVTERPGKIDVVSPEVRDRMATTIAAYARTRGATAEIASGCFSTSLGALWVKQVTPGVVTLGGAVAGTLAQQTAIAAFPLGAGLGAWWYGIYPAVPTPGLIATTIGAFAALGALVSIFSGIITDPIQRLLGVHRRRLLRLIDRLEDVLCNEAAGGFTLRDHYIARLLDLLDLTGGLLRTIHV